MSKRPALSPLRGGGGTGEPPERAQACDTHVAPFLALELLRCCAASRSWRRRWGRLEVWAVLLASGVRWVRGRARARVARGLGRLLAAVAAPEVRLDLGGSGLQDAGAAQLCEGLHEGLRALSLGLRGCDLREAGAVALARRLPAGLRSLCLDLHGCPLRAAGVRALAAALPAGLRRLSLEVGGCGFFLDDSAAAVAESLPAALADLKLHCGGCHQLTHRGAFAVFKRACLLEKLERLDLSFFGCGLGDQPLAKSFPASLASLSLDLSGCGLGDRAAAALGASLPEGLSELSLQAVGCGIGDAGAAALAEALPRRLRRLRLDLAGSSVTDRGAGAVAARLASLLRLEALQLGLGGCGVGDAALVALAGRLPACLRALSLDVSADCDCPAGSATAQGASTLLSGLPGDLEELSLDFRGCRLGAAGGRSIGSRLPPGLRELTLDFTGCGLEQEGATAIRDAISSLQHLKVETVIYDAFGGDEIVADPPDSSDDEEGPWPHGHLHPRALVSLIL